MTRGRRILPNRSLAVKSLESVAKNEATSGIHLWLLMMKAHRALQEKALKSIEETGLGFSDFTVLEILMHKGPLPVNTIAARIGLTSGSGTTAIDRLEKRGLVVRRNSDEDRRARVVHLTAAGKRLIASAFRVHTADMESAVEHLKESERTQLAELLRKLGQAPAQPAEGA